jgi:glycosyltransferase involved in cell wall biosynthesis
MAWCFQRSAVFVMTSRAEACPNITLEALSHGCRIVSIAGPPMPEFLADAAAYYPPGDTAALAERIASIARLGAAEAEALRRRAVGRSAEFTWQQTLDDTVEQLQLTATGRAGIRTGAAAAGGGTAGAGQDSPA